MDLFGNLSRQELYEVYYLILNYFIPDWFLRDYKNEIEEMYGLIQRYYNDDLLDFPIEELDVEELANYKSKIILEVH